jgi:hypothetical protein
MSRDCAITIDKSIIYLVRNRVDLTVPMTNFFRAVIHVGLVLAKISRTRNRKHKRTN